MNKNKLSSFMERNENKIKIMSWSFFLFLIGLVGIYFYFDLKKETEEIVSEEVVIEKEEEKIVETKNQVNWMVDIKGEVNVPGTYAVSDYMRVIDVIELAGGLTTSADTTILNLSKKISDQMVIVIYKKEEIKSILKQMEEMDKLLELCDAENIVNGACIDLEVKKDSIISINTATKEELMSLPGIGDAKASAIIKYKEEIGGFKALEELKEVPGIGESLFDSIKEYISL